MSAITNMLDLMNENERLCTLLRQREEALDLLKATCANKDWYMARQGDSFEALRQHGVRLEQQLAEANKELKLLYKQQEFICTTLQQTTQQLAASQARCKELEHNLTENGINFTVAEKPTT